MSIESWAALSPLVILGAFSLLLPLVIAFFRRQLLTAILAATGLFLAALVALLNWNPRTEQLGMLSGTLPGAVATLFTLDSFSQFYLGLLCLAALAVALLSYDYLRKRELVGRGEGIPGERPEEPHVDEYYLLLLLATLGAGVLVCSSHFASFFLGLEILSAALYVLIGYFRANERGTEAAIKYLVLAGVSSAFLVFGMAVVYAGIGTMEFARLASGVPAGDFERYSLLIGSGLIVVGAGFKLAVVPFHMWAPDVYEGAPAPVAAYIASVSKGAMFALLLRYFHYVALDSQHALYVVISLLAFLSMCAGNFLALQQRNLKRLLGYSSIAHLGYMLVAFLAGPGGAGAVTFYLVAYFVTIIASFGIISALSSPGRDLDRVEDYQGLFQRRPFLATGLALALLSLAGIPLTTGFTGKFYVMAAGIRSSLWWLVLALVVNSAVGLYYYLRVIIALTTPARAYPGLRPADSSAVALVSVGRGVIPIAALTVAVLVLLVIGLGVYPAPVMELVQRTVVTLNWAR